MLGLKFSDQNYKILLVFGLLTLGFLSGIAIAAFGFSPILAALPLGAVFFLLTVQRPWIALCLFFLLIPLEHLVVFEGTYTATLTKLIGGYLVFLVILTGNFKYIPELFKNKKTIWVMAFVVAAFLSLLFSDIPSKLLGELIRFLVFVALYITLILIIRDLKTLKYCIVALTIGAVLSVLSPMIFGFGSILTSSIERYGGLWGDQNAFAAIILTILPINFVLYLYAKNKLYKLILVASFFILLMGFFLTYSRGGFIALLFLIILAMFKMVKSKNRIKILLVIIPIILLSSIIFYNTIADEYITRVESLRALQSDGAQISEGSLNKRYIYYFDLAPKLFAEHPIFGTGLRGFIHYNTFYKQVTHNTYLEVLTGTGIVGFIPFIMILYLSWRELRKVQFLTKNIRELSFLNNLASAMELGFLALLICGMFISMDMNKVLWVFIALPSVMINILRIHIKRQSPPTQNVY